MERRAAWIVKVVLFGTLALLTSGAALLGGAQPAAACSCASVGDDEAFESADVVFIGTLAEIVTPEGDTYSSADPERFVFEVAQVFKGKAFARQSIVTAREGMSCGLEISGSGPFVVFAYLESDGVTTGAIEGELYSNLCSGTRRLSSGEAPAGFGSGSTPIPGSSGIGVVATENARSDGGSSADLVGPALAGLGLVGLIAASRIRRSRRR